MADNTNETSSNTASRPRKRSRKRTADREVPLSGNRSFVADRGGVHGTPSDPDRKGRAGAYAASSVIERGTADKLRADIAEKAEHLCVCGCGQQPSQADSLFMPGHDSKVRSMGKAVNEGRLAKGKLPPVARKYLEAGGMI